MFEQHFEVPSGILEFGLGRLVDIAGSTYRHHIRQECSRSPQPVVQYGADIILYVN